MTPSPESRLLDLIRKKSAPSRKERWMSWRLGVSRLASNRLKIKSIDFWHGANVSLFVLLLSTLGYGAFLLLHPETPNPTDLTHSRRPLSARDAAHGKHTLSELTGRDLFKNLAPTPPPPVVEIPVEPPPPPKIPLSVRASRFRLVGILSGGTPQAIIEDTQTQRMIYTTQGEQIDGIRVESVTAGKVVLSDGDERFDLML